MSDDGSEDAAPRPKRKIKRVVVMSSSSSSDSDESITVRGTRRKRMRVVSDGESESSGSSVICAGTRHKRTLPKLKDSDGDSDTSGWATDHSDAPKPAPTSATTKQASGFASDSSEGNSDKCSICLMRFTSQEVGTPQNCEHIFCLDCITEWSKNVNTCPVDRITFDSIVVRACAGGRVLRTEPVKVVERRPSVDVLVVEDPTVCEICGSSDNEETMLLCDGCDLGFHMQCLTPPLTEIPIDQWLCPNCDNILDVIHLSEVEDLFSDYINIDLPPRAVPLREPRNVRRSSRHQNLDEPSTSTGRRASGGNVDSVPTTSRGRQTTRRTNTRNSTTRRRTTGTQRRKQNRRRTKTVIIEYEVQENGKFPVTKTVKRKIKKRKVKKRQPQTAARRSHVRASVRAKLATLKTDPRQALREVSTASHGVQQLSMSRMRAGIPALSLLGNSYDLDYFSGDEHDVSEGGTAVAVRPTSSIISAYRQARRKMISIPSPPHASAAPDVLSSILESQTLLHSRNSVVEISVDGNVNIKLQTKKGQAATNANKERPPTKIDTGEKERIDLNKAQEDASRKAPSYPGQSRGGGGWGGGYRGTYHRDNSGGPYRGGYEQAAASNNVANNLPSYGSNGARRDDEDYGGFPRRPYNPPDDGYDRRRSLPEPERARRAAEARAGPAWPPYGPRPPRASYGDNPLDMRIGPPAHRPPPPPHSYRPEKPYRPLPEPPVFNFNKTQEVDRGSEDEVEDSDLVIDTEKYDPMEPTNDDSGDEGSSGAPALAADPLPAPAADPLPAPATDPLPAPAAAVPAPAYGPPPPPPNPPAMLQSYIEGLESMNVPAAVLDSAVRQVLNEHRALITPSSAHISDDEEGGDVPNFSIYSATSVHIASDGGALRDAPLAPPADDLADLVQEDDTPEPSAPVSPAPSPVDDAKRKIENEYKERVSKRCPITPKPRNPIKIKLTTHSLIKRQVSLYDEEEDNNEQAAEGEPSDSTEPTASTQSVANESTVEESSPISKEVDTSKEDIEPAPEIESKEDASENVSDKDSVSAPFAQDDKDESTPQPSENHKDDKEDDRSEDNSPLLEHATSPVEDEEDDEGDESPATAAARADSDQDEGDEKLDNEVNSNDAESEIDLPVSPKTQEDKAGEGIEKMTESISETEDERSYTPCLDENKSKDTSLETEKEKGIEGLDTEMISEDEGNGLFSEEERPRSRAAPVEDGEILERRRDKEKDKDDTKKKKKKDSKRDSKREGKEKTKNKTKKSEVGFKKLSKNGKERNYRDRDRDRRDSSDGAEKKRRRKEKRKDLERYDVRTVVTEKRRKVKDAFGRDVSPRARSASPASPPRRRRSPSPVRRRSPSPARRRSPSPARRRSPSPVRRRSPSPLRRRSPSPVRRRTASPVRRRSPSLGRRRSPSPARRRSPSLARRSPSARPALSPSPVRRSPTPRSASSPSPRRRRRSVERPRRRRSGERARKRRRSPERSPSPRAKSKGKRRRRARSARRPEPRRKSPKARRRRRSTAGSAVAAAAPVPAVEAWSPPSVDSRLLSPRTPPPEPPPEPRTRRRSRPRHKRTRDAAGPSKEVFTSGDNILVSVSFKDQERTGSPDKRERRERRKERRRRRRLADAETDTARPVAIIDLERSPFRELTPSPRNVIVLSDSEQGPAEAAPAPPATVAAEPPAAAAAPPAPSPAAEGAAAAGAGVAVAGGPTTPPEPPSSPDAYDPFEPTRSASGSPSPAAASPPRPSITLETAQKTNLSADDVIDRRPLSPMEKVMALLQSTRDVSPEPPPAGACATAGQSPAPPAPTPAGAVAPTPRIVLPDAPRPQPPKLFLAKPSPIKSDPIKPLQSAKPAAGPPRGDSPYSPGSSEFGELFEPPGRRGVFDALLGARRPRKHHPAKVPVKLKKKGKTQVGVKIDDDNLKILDDLPSSAVEMQVKSKFLKKLNRQERVVEEVKLVLKPHYNKKHVTKEEYKDILRRAVPKICHNKSGEINPTKIQALVEAYVKKFRKKHKLGLA